jgi:hypothetical protein
MMQTLEKDFPVRMICQMLGVSKTAYYRFCRGESYQMSEEKTENLEAVIEVFWEHKRRYGSRGGPAAGLSQNCEKKVIALADIRYER